MIKILDEQHIIDYYRYVDDILIVYTTHPANIDNTLTDFNLVQQQIQISIEKETHRKLNYQDLTITNQYNQLTFGIYSNPLLLT
jgi:hypothetical protein